MPKKNFVLQDLSKLNHLRNPVPREYSGRMGQVRRGRETEVNRRGGKELKEK